LFYRNTIHILDDGLKIWGENADAHQMHQSV